MNKNLLLIIIVTIISIEGMYLISKQADNFGGNQNSFNTFSGGVTMGSTSCQTVSTQVLARNVDRQYASFVNTDASNSVDIALGSTANLQSGIRIGPNRSSYEINSENLFVGVINCIAQNATSTLQWTEK